MVKILILWAHFVASVILAIDECNVAIVSRRTEDVLKLATSNATNCQHYACNDGNSTYLITEQQLQCVSNSNFFNGKYYRELHVIKIILCVYLQSAHMQ